MTAASIGLRDVGSSRRHGSRHALAFAGAASITIPSGAVAISDPVALRFGAGADLAISLYLGDKTSGATYLTRAHQTSYVVAGDATGSDGVGGGAQSITSWYFLSGVEVLSTCGRALVAFGDSITEGFASFGDDEDQCE